MKLIKRTFEALKYPKGSPERIKLNEKSETSEYMPSYKYDVETDVGCRAFRSKKEAVEFMDSK